MVSKMCPILLVALLAIALVEIGAQHTRARSTWNEMQEVEEWYCDPGQVKFMLDNVYRCFNKCDSCPNGFCFNDMCHCFPQTKADRAGICGKICPDCENGWCSSLYQCECNDGFTVSQGECVPEARHQLNPSLEQAYLPSRLSPHLPTQSRLPVSSQRSHNIPSSLYHDDRHSYHQSPTHHKPNTQSSQQYPLYGAQNQPGLYPQVYPPQSIPQSAARGFAPAPFQQEQGLLCKQFHTQLTPVYPLQSLPQSSFQRLPTAAPQQESVFRLPTVPMVHSQALPQSRQQWNPQTVPPPLFPTVRPQQQPETPSRLPSKSSSGSNAESSFRFQPASSSGFNRDSSIGMHTQSSSGFHQTSSSKFQPQSSPGFVQESSRLQPQSSSGFNRESSFGLQPQSSSRFQPKVSSGFHGESSRRFDSEFSSRLQPQSPTSFNQESSFGLQPQSPSRLPEVSMRFQPQSSSKIHPNSSPQRNPKTSSVGRPYPFAEEPSQSSFQEHSQHGPCSSEYKWNPETATCLLNEPIFDPNIDLRIA